MISDNDELQPKSKAQQKRDAEAAQVLGTAVVELPAADFKVLIDKIELPDKLHEALVACRSFKAREARRRQLQYIGKLMRDIDVTPIQQLLAVFKRSGQVATAQLHQIERWRERLLTEGDEAFNDLLRSNPEADAKHVRKLIISAHKELAHKQPPRAARLLFKYLRELMGG